MGTPELSCNSLRALIESPQFQVVAVVTQPDRPKGRELKLQPSPVKELALQAKLPVLQPERAREEAFLGALGDLQPDLVAVAAYGQILPEPLLSLPRFGLPQRPHLPLAQVSRRRADPMGHPER